MLMKAVFDDGSYIIGDCSSECALSESPGTHHLKVTEALNWTASGVFIDNAMVGQIVAIPITKPRYWVIMAQKAARVEFINKCNHCGFVAYQEIKCNHCGKPLEKKISR